MDLTGTGTELSLAITSVTEPHRLYGEGDYALTDVTEIEGTHQYLQLAEERRLCDKRNEDCVAAEYMEMGLTHCNCTPYQLREASLSKHDNLGNYVQGGADGSSLIENILKNVFSDAFT